jgi:thiol-disulfide isomerase/thioredoxin
MEAKDKEQKTIPKEEVKPQLYAFVELNSEEDLDKLKEFKCNPFYGYPGSQGYQYPYYGYPGQKVMPPAKKSEPIVEEKIAVFKCPVCDKEFPTLEEFQKHWTDVEKEQYGEYKEATSSEYYALKKDILDLKISLGGSIENLTKAKDERILAVKEAKESTKKEILEDFEDVTKRAEAEQSKWNSAGARRLVKECRDTINKHK